MIPHFIVGKYTKYICNAKQKQEKFELFDNIGINVPFVSDTSGTFIPILSHVRSENERLFYNTDFELCLSNDGQPITTGCVIPISLPMAGDFDFMCINNDKSLAPIIMPGDVIALKKLATWKTYIPGDFICVVVTSEYKVLRKVSVTQPDEQSINFTQMVDGTPVESSIPKDIIVEIYKLVGNYRRQ